MNFTLHPWQVYFLVLAGWANREQQRAIEYLRTENQVLKARYNSAMASSGGEFFDTIDTTDPL